MAFVTAGTLGGQVARVNHALGGSRAVCVRERPLACSAVDVRGD
jgi:hypothetical protein